MVNTFKNMPIPPLNIAGEKICLKFIEIAPGDSEKGYVPYYHFEINQANDVIVGHINFRIGETDHIKYCAGHIGFEIIKEFRGNSYSFFACLAFRPFVKSIYNSVFITANPQNLPSIKMALPEIEWVDPGNAIPNVRLFSYPLSPSKRMCLSSECII